MKKKCIKKNIKKKPSIIFGLINLLWFILRTGTRPSRVTYPCQRAALANSAVLLGVSVPLSVISFFNKTNKFLSEKGVTVLLILISTIVLIGDRPFWISIQAAEIDPNQELDLTLESRSAGITPASDIFVVNGREVAHIQELISLMGSHGLFFYKSNNHGLTQDPGGLIGSNDVVLIKINEEWPERGGSNTDVLKELIQAIVDHPDSFLGEIVVADNGQWQGSMDWPQSNAEDITQSTRDVVEGFSDSFMVSNYSWRTIRNTTVNEYIEGDPNDGYILYDEKDPETDIFVTYPKFQTIYGTKISFKYGIWNGVNYEDRLKIINLPVLKSHDIYGVTASVKNYMGVQSEGKATGGGGLANGHETVKKGSMGTLMVETGPPTLNIIDAIWVNANPPISPMDGPSTPYEHATKVNVLMASTDPVALDYWAAKHVLVQAASLLGYTDTSTLDPDNTEKNGLFEAYGVWLSLSRDELVADGYDFTNDENRMNVHVARVHLPIYEGWNLISTPFGDVPIESFFNENIIHLMALHTYQDGEWRHWFPEAPSEINEIRRGQGYWAFSGSNFVLMFNGIDINREAYVHGWNHIGINSTEPIPTTEYFSEYDWTWVYGYDQGEWLSYQNGVGGSLDTLYPGKGYWVYIDTI